VFDCKYSIRALSDCPYKSGGTNNKNKTGIVVKINLPFRKFIKDTGEYMRRMKFGKVRIQLFELCPVTNKYINLFDQGCCQVFIIFELPAIQ
jgi:hypothetical protein